MPDEAKLMALWSILTVVKDECESNPVANMLENHLKTVILEKLMFTGYSFLEGSSANTGKVLSFNGKVKIDRCERPMMNSRADSDCARNSPDIRVWEPCRLVVELQTRSILGTQDSLFSSNLADDLDRVNRGDADVFVFACDRLIYDAIRGVKVSNRGRKAKFPQMFAQTFPDSNLLTPNLTLGFKHIVAMVNSFGIERVVIGVYNF